MKSWCHTKRRAATAPRARPSFGVTTTQALGTFSHNAAHKWRVVNNPFRLILKRDFVDDKRFNISDEHRSNSMAPREIKAMPFHGRTRYPCGLIWEEILNI